MPATDMPPGFLVVFEMKEILFPDLTSMNGFVEQMWGMSNFTFVYDALYGKDVSG
jgi:hypothetical protein